MARDGDSDRAQSPETPQVWYTATGLRSLGGSSSLAPQLTALVSISRPGALPFYKGSSKLTLQSASEGEERGESRGGRWLEARHHA